MSGWGTQVLSVLHLEWLQPVILRHEIYLPTFVQLNDPRDGKPLLAEGIIDAVVHAVAGDHEVRLDLLQSTFESLVNVGSRIGMIGFGEAGDRLAGCGAASAHRRTRTARAGGR